VLLYLRHGHPGDVAQALRDAWRKVSAHGLLAAWQVAAVVEQQLRVGNAMGRILRGHELENKLVAEPNYVVFLRSGKIKA
jgi:phosphohistidine phosphatase SixA